MARAHGGRSLAWGGVALALKALAVFVMLATPILGVWVASSLTALRNGKVWWALAAGLLLFPIAPLVWELWSAWRRSRHKRQTARILATSDRLILRTLALNAAFLVLLLATQPSAAFTALSTRGDWMLDGRKDPSANRLRAVLFGAAAKLEWLYVLAHDNPFRKYSKQQPEPDPSSTSSTSPSPTPAPSSTTPRPATSSAPSPSPSPSPTPQAPSWPMPERLEPVIVNMPTGSEASIQSVARYVAERTATPLQRLKALHDWVADRVSYDVESYLSGNIPTQDAETIFGTRRSVCAGYANLLEALAHEAGLEVALVVGDARTMSNDLSGQGHAWNAAKLDGRWYLLDATWDSGYVNGAQFTRRYSTAYFLTPPQVFDIDHFPDDAKWQLLEKPLTRGEFLRQPPLTPKFFASGLELIAPDRSQVDVTGHLEIQLKNHKKAFLLASYLPRSGPSDDHPCFVTDGRFPEVQCVFRTPGSYQVRLYANDQPQGSFDYVGQLEVNSK